VFYLIFFFVLTIIAPLLLGRYIGTIMIRVNKDGLWPAHILPFTLCGIFLHLFLSFTYGFYEEWKTGGEVISKIGSGVYLWSTVITPSIMLVLGIIMVVGYEHIIQPKLLSWLKRKKEECELKMKNGKSAGEDK